MIRIYIILDEKSMAGLVVLAKQEYRDPRQQASIIVRQELLRRGFLSDNLRGAANPSAKYRAGSGAKCRSANKMTGPTLRAPDPLKK